MRLWGARGFVISTASIARAASSTHGRGEVAAGQRLAARVSGDAGLSMSMSVSVSTSASVSMSSGRAGQALRGGHRRLGVDSCAPGPVGGLCEVRARHLVVMGVECMKWDLVWRCQSASRDEEEKLGHQKAHSLPDAVAVVKRWRESSQGTCEAESAESAQRARIPQVRLLQALEQRQASCCGTSQRT